MQFLLQYFLLNEWLLVLYWLSTSNLFSLLHLVNLGNKKIKLSPCIFVIVECNPAQHPSHSESTLEFWQACNAVSSLLKQVWRDSLGHPVIGATPPQKSLGFCQPGLSCLPSVLSDSRSCLPCSLGGLALFYSLDYINLGFSTLEISIFPKQQLTSRPGDRLPVLQFADMGFILRNQHRSEPGHWRVNSPILGRITATSRPAPASLGPLWKLSHVFF